VARPSPAVSRNPERKGHRPKKRKKPLIKKKRLIRGKGRDGNSRGICSQIGDLVKRRILVSGQREIETVKKKKKTLWTGLGGEKKKNTPADAWTRSRKG